MENKEHRALKLLGEHFSKLTDPRGRQGRLHKFHDIVVIGILATICGADEWTEMEDYALSKRPFLSEILELPNGIPSHDTFGRVFGMIDPEAFRMYFNLWIKDLCDMFGEVVSIDGKQLRGSYDTASDKAAIYMVSAWADANNVVLGQVKVPDKSNEITAVPRLLDMLDLAGSIVTIDAMGCQKEIAQQIVANDADYVLAVKGNQAALHEELVESFEKVGGDQQADQYRRSSDRKAHGRKEHRTAYVLPAQDWISQDVRDKWVGLKSLVKIESLIEHTNGKAQGKVTSDIRYYISSLSPDAAQHARIVRCHWGIENKVHWVLDVAFREDHSRIRKGYGPENMALLRHIALNKLKNETTFKRGIKAKRKKAGWNDDYLIKVLIT